MIRIDNQLKPSDLLGGIAALWELSAGKIRSIEKTCPPSVASPVFTVAGQYTARGWTEWTRGFQYGSAILQFDATADEEFLAIGRQRTLEYMASHVTAAGVHDHGFNNVSTYGNLLRLMREGRIIDTPWERHFYELALRCSGAVQAMRWRTTDEGGGYMYSFNGPHSLFADTIRSLRSLALAYRLGQTLEGENDARISLLERLVSHARTTARYNVYYGRGRDAYDVRGRVAHESLFNANDGRYRCPSSQQGYSPFTTWMRGLAWIMLGYSELLEFLASRDEDEFAGLGGAGEVEAMFRQAAEASCDFYLANTPTDGVPYWDSGAPLLGKLGDYLNRPAEPFNAQEPVDSSAAAIACQGLLRLGFYLAGVGEAAPAKRYFQAGLCVLKTLLGQPYISQDPAHQGLLLHSVYHRPNGWDHVPAGRKVPCCEGSLWGDYHLREAALYVQRLAKNQPYYAFFGPVEE